MQQRKLNGLGVGALLLTTADFVTFCKQSTDPNKAVTGFTKYAVAVEKLFNDERMVECGQLDSTLEQADRTS